ncbi:MAG: ABC transporter ATP-binding protein [Ruminococcaceae bacterium]|nr:ABC transporter ATP-binding protein [Oscillospiraceae bacterium]
MIKLEGINKEYILGKTKVKVLEDININIDKGEFVGIVGQSGSGKSTLSNIIAGLLKPTGGKVEIEGRDIWSLGDRKISEFRNKTLGFVFQSFNLIPGMTALENVMLPLAYSKIKHKNRIEYAKEELLKVGLEDRIYHKPNEMSGGQMQRVSIARAMINKPKIIIADEPTGNLDSDSSDVIINLIKQINKNGVTVIMVTHNLDYKKHFTKLITLRNGKII